MTAVGRGIVVASADLVARQDGVDDFFAVCWEDSSSLQCLESQNESRHIVSEYSSFPSGSNDAAYLASPSLEEIYLFCSIIYSRCQRLAVMGGRPELIISI